MLTPPAKLADQFVQMMRARGLYVMTLDRGDFYRLAGITSLKPARRARIEAELLKRAVIIGWGNNVIVVAVDRNFATGIKPPPPPQDFPLTPPPDSQPRARARANQ